MAKYQKYAEYKDSGISWLGEVPSSWKLERFKWIINEKIKTYNSNLPAGAISFGEVIYKNEENLALETKASYQEVLEGEFLINPLNLNYDLKSLRTALSKIDVVVSTGYIVVRAHQSLNKKFFRWLLHEFDVAHMKTLGAGVRQTVNFADIANCYLYLPSLEEQSQIANFLDHETAKIDHLIEKQQQLIELLKEKRQAVISHAVTKGLDPNVPMKDSGVEWLGEVPEHWILSNLKYFASIQGGYAFNSDLFVEEGTQVLRIGNVYQNTLSLDRQPIYISNELVKNFKDFIVSKNDVLMSLTGTLGKRDYGFAIKVKTDEKYLLNQRVAKISPNLSKIDTDFMVYVLWSESYLTQLYSLPSGTKQANLSNSDVLGIQIVVPPSLEEQKDIAKYLKNKLLKFDDMILKAESAISLMQERRTALISAAVTGKIDVRNWQAPTLAGAQTELSA
ncbi:restriction endonuclease subunit S [Acinetobacter baumannii]|uniref:Restriction endonuclease subunit S n=1 Tax=Acinetobacter baumannii TaxID=470 RepID=A0A6L8M6Q1_ACIBA|nr:restriction endonuclease subunit S [Acinetobacter baumannii]MCJ8817070.1 restriction endonuclease subunit S [Acinetobacter baumannii]MCJ8987833.1 restriction endonuclease subunit S [Acinetobacter baumannii]MCJ8990704.1 restriction endonuclease subunit S [Acinetobacter baumannii]MDD1363883.1 restriction endonuclease subunit S [Acinetobacter baumannii]MDP7922439.1 restriction endonuclease subunit S [Acinetobacter baumannii]